MKRVDALIEGVRNCMVKHGNLQEGENVLIISETITDPLVTEAFVMVAKSVGAKPIVIEIEPIAENETTDPPIILMEAMKGADVAFGLLNSPSLWRSAGVKEAAIIYGTRYVSLATMATYECLSSRGPRWPMEIYYEICRRHWDIAFKSKTIRVTCAKGTDLRAEVSPDRVAMGEVESMKSGEFMRIFMPPHHHIDPGESGNGVIVADAFYGWGLLDEPLKLTIKDGWIVDIKGGAVARELDEYMSKIENAKHFVEITWASNPHVRKNLSGQILYEFHTKSGIIHMGFGDNIKSLRSRIKVNCTIMASPSVYLDKEVIVDHGRLTLLNDPAIRKFAEKFGDPDVLLADL